MKTFKLILLKMTFVVLFICSSFFQTKAQHSIAYEWSEVLLDGIRNDYARPTVHARNLFHASVAMYDAWAILNPGEAETYLLGKTVHGITCAFNSDSLVMPTDVKAAQEEAISYAMYTLMSHRFVDAPGVSTIFTLMDDLMISKGYDINFTSQDYTTGSYAALGNYIGQCVINYGLQDGSNESGEYENLYYQPVNDPLIVADTGNSTISDPNHWQPLTLDVFIDQSGNPIPLNTPDFLSPEWGNVMPFSLTEDDKTVNTILDDVYNVYHDPGVPPLITSDATRELYQWNFSLVSIWGSHLDPSDGVMWDISPASIGNNPDLPTSFEDYPDFYNYLEGGDQSQGHDVNPVTGLPYEPQMVPRGDYARVLAEFWADGPHSETPPGHWFTLLNYVLDHPLFEKRFEGEGEILDDLEFDVKAYFIMGGTMHDAAITAWGIKGWYDYIRPVSAIRYMADQGQGSDMNMPSFDPHGIPLVDGLIELVQEGDPLAGEDNENLLKVKLYSWKGPDYIEDEEEDVAGVGWIMAGNWWPYQRPSFITPPFAGYISGHSTYSRAAAEVMTLLTGDEFFPGGMGEFEAPMNEYLVFEDGPSMDITLQWATYRDASDQCSLSRIWGGIHPPADDIPGRLIGIELGPEAFNFAKSYFETVSSVQEVAVQPLEIYPNPIQAGQLLDIPSNKFSDKVNLQILDATGKMIQNEMINTDNGIHIATDNLSNGMYIFRINDEKQGVYQGQIVVM